MDLSPRGIWNRRQRQELRKEAIPVTVTDAGKHIKNITKKYFSGANVDFANRSSRVKSKAPFVCIVPDTADGG